MGSLRCGGGRNGLQMENAENDNLQAIAPRVRATFEAAIAQQHFKQMEECQEATGQIDQMVQRKYKRHEQIEQHHQPEQ
ncbi:hypothetical protein D3C86_2097040 [compost metagenome]